MISISIAHAGEHLTKTNTKTQNRMETEMYWIVIIRISDSTVIWNVHPDIVQTKTIVVPLKI